MTKSSVKNYPETASGAGMPRWMWALVALAVARALLLPTFELVPQEAYYAFYAAHPALSYFDHPPLLAWLLLGAFRLFGRSVWALRLVPFVLTLGTQWAFLPLARRFVPGASGRAALLFATTGALTLVSLIALPDVPLLLCWTVAVGALARALFDGRRWAWPVAGVFIGLAFDSKYTGAGLLLGLFLFLVLSPPHRRLLFGGGPLVAFAVSQLVSLPVYLWNAEHGWASFLFQTAGRAESAAGLGVRNVFALLGSQAVLLLPPLFAALAWAAGRGLKGLARKSLSPEDLFLAVFTLPVLGAGLLLSTAMVVKANWLLPAYVTGILLVARKTGPRLLRWNLWCSAVLHAAFLVELFLYPVVLRTDDTWVGWRGLSRAVSERVKPGDFVFSADDYKTTSELLFYSQLEVYGRNVLGERALQFDYAGGELGPLLGRDALFIDSLPKDPEGVGPAPVAPPRLVQAFREVRAEPPVHILVGGRTVRTFAVWRCLDYLGPPGR